MLNLLAGTDLIERRAKAQAPKAPRLERRKTVRPRRAVVRSTSAAALRGLADLVEPSPS